MGKGFLRWSYEKLDEALFGRAEADRLREAIAREEKRLEVSSLRAELERLRAKK